MNKLLTSCLFLLLVHCLKAQNNIDSSAIRFSLTINKSELKEHLEILASDEYEGRETGKNGQKKSAAYLSEQFSASGILPYNGSWYQEFELLEKSTTASITVNGVKFDFKKDFYFFPGFTDTILNIKEIVFTGFGIDDKKYSDYKSSVKGKFLVVLDGEPFDKDGKSLITGTERSSEWTQDPRRKITVAKEKGAAGMIIIKNDFEKSYERLKHFILSPAVELKKHQGDNASGRKRLHAFFISPSMAGNIINSNEIEKLKTKIKETGKTASKKIKIKLEINVSKTAKEMSSENVIAFIEGTDKKDEILVLTAHYDHLGKDGDEVYNGADDDGSGTVALIEIAEAFSEACKNGKRPRRSILIMPVSGEEKGLLGSYYYSENPLFQLEKTIANLNIDMIGRSDTAHKNNPDYVYVIGSDMLSKELHGINESANKKYSDVTLDYTYNSADDPSRFYYRSDHYNFARKNIPVIFYFTGVHEDYHKPTDEVSKIDFDKMEKITRMIFFTAWELANREERPALNKDH